MPNDEDGDSDNDNTSDEVECPNAGQCPDTDRDGLPDFLDNDTNSENPQGNDKGDADNDGISDVEECPNWVYCPDEDKNNIPDFIEKNEARDELIDLRPLLIQVLRNVNQEHSWSEKVLGTIFKDNYRRAPRILTIFGIEKIEHLASQGYNDRSLAEMRALAKPLCRKLVMSDSRRASRSRGREYSRLIKLTADRYKEILQLLIDEFPKFAYPKSYRNRPGYLCKTPNHTKEILRLMRLIKSSRDMAFTNYRQCESNNSKAKSFLNKIKTLYKRDIRIMETYKSMLFWCEKFE